jgi:hypothetical protein
VLPLHACCKYAILGISASMMKSAFQMMRKTTTLLKAVLLFDILAAKMQSAFQKMIEKNHLL